MKMRHCKFQGCRKILPYEIDYCDEHLIIVTNENKNQELKAQQLKEMSVGYQQSDRRTRYSNSSRFDEIGAGFYQSQAWRKLSTRIRVRDLYTCQVCGKVQGVNESYVVDHIVKRRLDETKAMNSSNLWLICRRCHNVKTALENKLLPEKQMVMTKDEWQQMIRLSD